MCIPPRHPLLGSDGLSCCTGFEQDQDLGIALFLHAFLQLFWLMIPGLLSISRIIVTAPLAHISMIILPFSYKLLGAEISQDFSFAEI